MPPTDEPITSDKRLKALHASGLLDSPAEADFDRITKLVCQLLAVDTALLSLVAADRQFFKSNCGLPNPWAEERQTPLSHSFCQHVVATDAPLIISDAKTDPRVAGNLAIPDLGVAAYLGVPVHAPGGETLGALCAISGQPKAWSDEDKSRLKSMAEIVESELRLREQARTAAALAQENEVLAREYHHRVKNALAVSAALVTLSGKEATSVPDVIDKARSRLSALAQAHDSLIAKSDAVDLKELAARLLRPYCSAGAVADVDGPFVVLRYVQVTPICLFLHELATNSAKYGAFSDGSGVAVRWREDDGNVSLLWDERSASISTENEGGFGTNLIKLAAVQLHGTLKTDWQTGRMLATLEFPLG